MAPLARTPEAQLTGGDVPKESRVRNDSLRIRILQRIDLGRLPVFIPGTVQAGYGAGLRCYACGDSITRSQIEYHVNDPSYGPPMNLHFDCYFIWQTECVERLRGTSPAA